MRLRCKHISKSYTTRGSITAALVDVSFEVDDHEFVCVIGPSGCGKTTLLKILAGLLEPTSGQVVFDQGLQAAPARRAMVFQEHGLFPWMTLIDNVAFGLKMQGLDERTRIDRAASWIDRFGLGPFAAHYPRELSVGMRQRAGIARAFLVDPEVLLMDEPFGSLDAQTRLILQDELLKVWLATRNSVIYVTHDIEEAIRLGDRVLVMSGRPGRIRSDIPILIDRSRRLTDALNGEGSEIKWQIWKTLEDEVRAGLLHSH